jgi:hypothetical protein
METTSESKGHGVLAFLDLRPRELETEQAAARRHGRDRNARSERVLAEQGVADATAYQIAHTGSDTSRPTGESAVTRNCSSTGVAVAAREPVRVDRSRKLSAVNVSTASSGARRTRPRPDP